MRGENREGGLKGAVRALSPLRLLRSKPDFVPLRIEREQARMAVLADALADALKARRCRGPAGCSRRAGRELRRSHGSVSSAIGLAGGQSWRLVDRTFGDGWTRLRDSGMVRFGCQVVLSPSKLHRQPLQLVCRR
jgi:hypothetical protein